MNYTAKKLGDLAGISVRTLHWYDKIGLLKPSHIGENDYRYYGRKELYFLQQILFFRELNFSLEEIKDIIYRDDFNQISALEQHRVKLREQLQRTQTLIETIDLTIEDLEGKKQVHDKDLYQGFFQWSDGMGESKVYIGRFNSQDASDSERIFLESAKNGGQASWSKEQWEQFSKIGDRIFTGLAELEASGTKADSKAVQGLISDHYNHMGMLHQLDRSVYEALADLMATKPQFRKQIATYGKDLPEFMAEAMMIWLSKNDLK